MFEELEAALGNLTSLGQMMTSRANELRRTVRRNAQEALERVVAGVLVEEAKDALDTCDELNYEPLRSHLLINLSHHSHHRINPHTLRWEGLNKSYIGTEQHLRRGQMAAWGPKTASATPQRRWYGWVFGIYRPSREGHRRPPQFPPDYPSYDDIIEQRMEAWGHRAPYWIVLNNGTTGSRAYPRYKGSNFVQKTENKVNRQRKECLEAAEEQVLKDLDVAWENDRLFVGNAMGKSFSVQKHISPAGLLWYQVVIDGQFGQRIYPGEVIKIDGVSTGLEFEL